MPEVELLIRAVREVATNMVGKCSAALDAGMSIDRVHGHYFRRVTELVAEAEAQAILAVEGSTEAVAAIERCGHQLVGLAADLARELAQAAGDEPDC